MNAKNTIGAVVFAAGALWATVAKAWDTMDPGADSRVLTAAEVAAICGDAKGRTNVILGETEDWKDICEISVDNGKSWSPLALAGGLGLLGTGVGVIYLIRRRKRKEDEQQDGNGLVSPMAAAATVAAPTQDKIVDLYRGDSRVSMNGDIIDKVTIGNETYDLSSWTIDDQNPGQYTDANGSRIVLHEDGKIEHRLDGTNADNNVAISHVNGAIERYDATGTGSVTFPNGDVVTEYTSYDGANFINGVRHDASGNEVERYSATPPAASAAVAAALGTSAAAPQPAAVAAPALPPVVLAALTTNRTLPLPEVDTLDDAKAMLESVRKIRWLEVTDTLSDLGFTVAIRDDGTDEPYIVPPEGLEIKISGEAALKKAYKIVGGKVVKKLLGLI